MGACAHRIIINLTGYKLPPRLVIKVKDRMDNLN